MTELEKLTKDLNEAEEKLRAAPDDRVLKRIIVNRKADIAKLRGKRQSAYGTVWGHGQVFTFAVPPTSATMRLIVE